MKGRARALVVGGAIDRVHASLSFTGDDLQPDKMTTRLGCRPTDAHSKGDVKQVGPRRYVKLTGHWSRHAGPWKKEDVGKAIERVMNVVDASPPTLRSLARRFNGRIWLGLSTERFNRGFDLQPTTLKMMADRGLKLTVDIYAYGPGRLDTSSTKTSRRKRSRSRA